MLKNHIRFCSIYDCQCKKIQFCEEYLENDLAEKEKSDDDGITQKEENVEQTTYEILNTTIKNFHTKESLTDRHLIIANVNFYMQKRLFTALYNLMLAEEHQASFLQQFHIFSLRFSLKDSNLN